MRLQLTRKVLFSIFGQRQRVTGVKEICSSLFTFLSTTDVCDDKKKLIAWSDSCPGQNKNFAMIAFWQYVLLTKRFASIEHKFPIPGHTFLDSDRDFGKVETAVKRREHIYSVDEYQNIMLTCMRKAKPSVTRVGDKMLDLDKLV